MKAFLSRPFGNLGIGISASASPLTSALQKIYFCLQNFFLNNRIFMLFLVLSSLRFPIHPFKGIHWCSRKRLFEHSEASSIGVSKKQLLRKFLHTLHTFQRNFQGGVLFKYTCRPSWDCSKRLFTLAILQRGIYPSNLDVRYSAQKTQSFN